MNGRRIAVVGSEVLGRPGTGGAGTADSLLAVALGRHGHRVRLIVASGREIGRLDDRWTEIYASAHVEVQVLAQLQGVRPAYLRPTLEVFHALREEPPDVAIVDDWRGLGYASLRARQLGRGLSDTAFVVHCHGTARVLAEFAQKVPDTLARFGDEIAERASIELADAVVSPSEWLLGWMRQHRWPVPTSASILPYVRQGAALDEIPARAETESPIRRLAFFGQLREGKGVRIYLDALNALEINLLDGIELLFLGRETPRWSKERVSSSLADSVRNRAGTIRFETSLERSDALSELLQPGTLAVMPSLLDNSPNTVYECLEHGVPFVSTKTGGIPELVSEVDRDRVLCRPSAGELAAKLTEALASSHGFAPAAPGFDSSESLAGWLELADTVRPLRHRTTHAATKVSVISTGECALPRAKRLAEATRSVDVEVVADRSRRDGLARATGDWVMFLDDDDEPDRAMLDKLVAAQASSDADVVTAGVTPAGEPSAVRLFLGAPGALGLVANEYGVLGLVRRSLLSERVPEGPVDPDWPLLARLALSGARIVSLPEALSTHSGRVGSISDVPGEGLGVLEAFEASPVAELDDLPQLAATLAAAHARVQGSDAHPGTAKRSVLGRSATILRDEGVLGLARRGRTRLATIRAYARRSRQK